MLRLPVAVHLSFAETLTCQMFRLTLELQPHFHMQVKPDFVRLDNFFFLFFQFSCATLVPFFILVFFLSIFHQCTDRAVTVLNDPGNNSWRFYCNFMFTLLKELIIRIPTFLLFFLKTSDVCKSYAGSELRAWSWGCQVGRRLGHSSGPLFVQRVMRSRTDTSALSSPPYV